MKYKLCRGALATVVFCAIPGMAAADELNLTIANGRVTLIAQDVTIRQILAEWARVGQTTIDNGDKMIGPPVTLELRDVPEGEALETVLRSAAGYMIAPRAAGRVGASNYERIVILATSQPPVVSTAPQPTFNAPNMPRPIPQPIIPAVSDDENEAQNVGDAPGMQQFPGVTPEPGMQQFPQGQAPQGPLTAPRPGQLPQPNVPGNPYRPGVRPPGMPPVPGAPQQPTKPGGGGQ